MLGAATRPCRANARLRGWTKAQLTAVQRLFRAGLALPVCFADTSPKGRGLGIPQRFVFHRKLFRSATGGGRRRCKWLDGWFTGRKH